MVEKSQSLRRGRDFTHELVVLKSKSFNSLVDDKNYTSLKTIRTHTPGNYERPVPTPRREDCTAVDKEEVEDAPPSVDRSPTQEREDVELEKHERFSLKNSKCHLFAAIIIAAVLAILVITTLVLAVLSLSRDGVDTDMIELMAREMFEEVRTALNESVTRLEANLTQLGEDFQEQSKDSAANIQNQINTLRHNLTLNIDTLNATDRRIVEDITRLSETHSTRLNQVESRLNQNILNLNDQIRTSENHITKLREGVNHNKMNVDILTGRFNDQNTYSEGNFTFLNYRLAKLNTTVQKMTCNCSCCP